MFITSPNSYHLPDEIWGHQQVRLRRNYHYGEHDPLLMPQYLDPRVIYLSLIRLPDAEPPFHILWRRPEEDEFEVMDGFKLAELPIGRLQKEFVEALERAYHQLYHSVNDARPSSSSDTPATPSLRSDSKFKDYCGRIRFLLAHLTTAVLPFSEALMCSCVCQRNILEMDAYITWMLYVKPTWGEAHSWRKTKTRSVVGGITDKPDLTEHCFRASNFFLLSFGSADLLTLIIRLEFRYGGREDFPLLPTFAL